MKWEMHYQPEQFCYLGTQEFEGTLEEAVAQYNAIKEAFKPQPVNQMPRNEFNEILDMVIMGKPIQDDPGILDPMSPIQRTIINEAKKSFKRRRDSSEEATDYPN